MVKPLKLRVYRIKFLSKLTARKTEECDYEIIKTALMCTSAIGTSVALPSLVSMLPGVTLASVYAQEQKTTKVPHCVKKCIAN